MNTLIIFFIVLFVLVMVHEFGHFIAAKISKMRVEEFAFGFPPRLFSKKIKETEYSFNALPIGGYVKITGESFDEEENKKLKDDKMAFQNRPHLLQLFVLSAGIIMNLFLAFLIFIFINYGNTFVSANDPKYSSIVQDKKMMVVGVAPNSPSYNAGLRPKDIILNVSSEGKIASLDNPEDVINFVKKNIDNPINITFKKENQEETKTVTITAVEGITPDRKSLGLALDYVGRVDLNLMDATAKAFLDTINYTKMTFIGIYEILIRLLQGDSVMNALAGPVGIAKLVGSASEFGIEAVLIFTAILSINLAVFNALPIPALDGGRMVFVLIEMLSRRKLNLKFQYWANSISFSLLLILVLIVTIFDILR